MGIFAGVVAGNGGMTQRQMEQSSFQRASDIAKAVLECVSYETFPSVAGNFSDYYGYAPSVGETTPLISVIYGDNKNRAFNANRELATAIAEHLNTYAKPSPEFLSHNVFKNNLNDCLNNLLLSKSPRIIVAGPPVIGKINDYFQNRFGIGNGHKNLSEAQGILYNLQAGEATYIP